ncbi:MAG: diguanylate cyclase [Anaerolineales bacterium]
MKRKNIPDPKIRRRVNELEVLIQRTEVLYSIADAGIKSKNLADLLQRIVDNIARDTSADRVSMIILNQLQEKIEHYVQGGASAHYIDRSVPYSELMDGLCGWVIRNKQSALSPKGKPDPRESAAAQKRREKTNCGSIIVSPIQYPDHILGTITVINDPQNRDFTLQDVQLIETAAKEVALAIVKASAYQELEQTNESLKEYARELESHIKEHEKTVTRQAILYETLQAVGKHLDVIEIAKAATESIAHLSAWTSVAISLPSLDGKTWKTVAGSGKTVGQFGQPRTVDQGVIGRVYRTGELQHVPDISADPDYFRGAGTISQSELAVPIKHHETVLGVLNIESDKLNDLNDEDISLARSLAEAISLAMSNAYQYAETQVELNERKHTEELLRSQNHYLTALHKITFDLINQRDIDDLLQSIVDQASDFLEVPYCEIMLKEGEDLVVRAFTHNQPIIKGDRARREEAVLSWQAFDTCLPAVINDYAHWSQRRPLYDNLKLSAVAAIPILLGGRSIGVLDISTSEPGYNLGDSDIQAATMLAQLAALAIDNTQLHQALRQELIRDALTGLFNRRFMEEVLPKELSRVQRKSMPLVIVIFDLDRLKDINDTYGHGAGDEALIKVSQLLKASIREGDTACRYGGDEFIVILPEIHLEDVYQRMEHLRQALKQTELRHEGRLLNTLSISVGMAEYPTHGTTREALLKAADKALYHAKNSGRDQVIKAK